ncbi:hypothetical protein ACYFX5_25800 [Bremerella sp. T1]|uniref:hypothetical protein n=1 Tax=Bremerella sp. TYQ1 TaxID=3119568 RepID=UPI001CCE02FB|nr:hypothetical protein [Bremerella volcania]UBM36425.1 hypothetical protein LA756_00650 [Bremerella volcania]
MKPRWLYLLLILALLLPGTRPRFASAIVAGSAPLQGAPASNTNRTQTEEEEVHERSAISRQCQRIAFARNQASFAWKLRQYRRFSSAIPAMASIQVAFHNGFGGNITS